TGNRSGSHASTSAGPGGIAAALPRAPTQTPGIASLPQATYSSVPWPWPQARCPVLGAFSRQNTLSCYRRHMRLYVGHTFELHGYLIPARRFGHTPLFLRAFRPARHVSGSNDAVWLLAGARPER